ncbi:MAG: hypothetical protein HMLKMBBP_02597 [Planctomycetes bacterium]|nr:hypothetical protein [Planctomycetota bacterium]
MGGLLIGFPLFVGLSWAREMRSGVQRGPAAAAVAGFALAVIAMVLEFVRRS